MISFFFILVFTYLVVEMPKYINPFMNQILPPIWSLITQVADVYVKTIINQTKTNDDDDSKFFLKQ